MKKTSAEIISDSISPLGIRLTTVKVVFPRMLLPEFNTHRVFSRNFRSSRAVPVVRLLEEVRTSPYEPYVWLRNKSGMQGGEPMSPEEILVARKAWQVGALSAADTAERLAKSGVHKQWANRGLEPYLYAHGVVTATEWDNFFELRDHKDAQPEIEALAKAIKGAFEGSVPETLRPGEWHLPFVTDYEKEWLDLETQRKVSVARCARTSYLTHEGKMPLVHKDLQLYHDLVGARPLHASPAEHQATPDVWSDPDYAGEFRWAQPELHGNLVGFVQNRKIIEREIA
ncbi:FAD-dependent thymidylate synthase [Bradyrhizobium elkanii]|uniref:Thymidylate synthase n=1 Tax=Bradyrhizobium elkanii TaxID=29448 RepID=A0ABV4EZU3_BRAEL|nr:FAD-dependent thymidylate synthase [Bradyrhizobium elkanii]WLB05937.1 FAD-dependent thymidylate synthase [Bradyrhizobium elkanii]